MCLVKDLMAALLIWAALFNCTHAQPTGDNDIIQVWSYYESRPFKTDDSQSGLSKDFVAFLNEQANGQYLFKLDIIPRVRLNYYLKKQQPGVVLFVNWSWMGENAKQKYLWSHPILHDRNEIVSYHKDPIQFNGADSLKGLTFAAIRGRRYLGLDELMEQDIIHRRFVYNESSVLMLIASGRVKVTSMARTHLLPHIKKHQLQGKLFLSDKPLFKFTRHIMTTKELPRVHKFIQEVTQDIKGEVKWQAILEKYNLHDQET